MNWFGRKSARDGARPALVRTVSGIAAGVGWARGYEAQVRESYGGNAIAQRAVRIVAEAVAEIPRYGDERAVALIDQETIERAATHLLLHGNSYLLIGGDEEGTPRRLYPLRPERVAIEAGADGWPAFYIYRAGERTARYPAEDAFGRPSLVHLRLTSPTDDHYGLGCLGAADGAIRIHNAATRWNQALLDNAARPSGALVYDPGDAGAALSPEQFDRLKVEMEAGFAGAANAGRPMLLEGGLRWQAISMTPADMDFVGLKAAAAREIALAFGVPPLLLGLPGDNSYANYAEANRALYRLTAIPLAGKIAGAVAAALGTWWPGATLALDLDAVPAMAADREKLWAMAAAADFLSPDEKREMLGFGRREKENAS